MSECNKSYIKFELIRETAKTKVYKVVNVHHGVRLGEIKWNGAWRQYCFFPDGETTWSAGCLQAVTAFIQNLMKERKEYRMAMGGD